MDELHIPTPGYNLASSELLTEQLIAEESELCYIKLKKAGIEETRAEPTRTPTEPVGYTKGFFL